MCISTIARALDACDRLDWQVTKRDLRYACANETMKSAEAYAISILDAAARQEQQAEAA
jgi:hypothetical protein